MLVVYELPWILLSTYSASVLNPVLWRSGLFHVGLPVESPFLYSLFVFVAHPKLSLPESCHGTLVFWFLVISFKKNQIYILGDSVGVNIITFFNTVSQCGNSMQIISKNNMFLNQSINNIIMIHAYSDLYWKVYCTIVVGPFSIRASIQNGKKNSDSHGMCFCSLHLWTILASSLHLEMGLSVLSVGQPWAKFPSKSSCCTKDCV